MLLLEVAKGLDDGKRSALYQLIWDHEHSIRSLTDTPPTLLWPGDRKLSDLQVETRMMLAAFAAASTLEVRIDQAVSAVAVFDDILLFWKGKASADDLAAKLGVSALAHIRRILEGEPEPDKPA